jgi:hypothetical protein
MKTLGTAALIIGAVFAAFIAGVASNQTVLMLAGFCMWTPSAVFLGWAFARSGLRITASTASYAPVSNHQPPSSLVANGEGRPPRRREPRREEFQ